MHVTTFPPVALGAAEPAPAEVPSPALPGVHFAGALAMFVCGTIGLVVEAPDLARGSFFAPEAIAVVHLFTLGWITLSIFGALCQFLPIAVGRGFRFPRLAYVSFALQLAGAIAFVGALHGGGRTALMIGGAGVAAAFVTVAINLAATLASVRERSLTWWALAGAAVFLVVTPLYGLTLALDLHGGALGGMRFHYVAIHAHVAIVGVVLLVMVGVANHLLPMFLLSHVAGAQLGWIAIACLFGGAAALAVPGAPPLLGASLAAGGVLAFLVQALTFFRHRRRRAIDPGMRLAAAGLVGLAGAVALAPFALGRGLADLHLLTAYFALLLGAISMFVAGHYYKIVPFLVWYHRFGPLVGTRKVPKVAELYSSAAATVDGALLVAGWLGLVAAIAAGNEALARVAALTFAAGAVLEAVVIARVARRRPA